MDIKTPAKKFTGITFDSAGFKELTDYLQTSKDDGASHLSLFLGPYRPHKDKAVRQLAEAVNLPVEQLDFNDLISKAEAESFRNLDRLFDSYENGASILYFVNGDTLCGAYTGFTKSMVKYATPQERYFLKKIQDFKGIAVIDITDYSAADATMQRAAQSLVKFPLPKSPVRRLLWQLRHYSFNGYDFKTPRPDAYAETG